MLGSPNDDPSCDLGSREVTRAGRRLELTGTGLPSRLFSTRVSSAESAPFTVVPSSLTATRADKIGWLAVARMPYDS